MARRWNKLGWRPEAVVKYLFKQKRTAAVPLNFTDKDVDDAEDDDDDDDNNNNNNNNNNVNANADVPRRQRDDYDDLSSASSDSSTDVSIRGIYSDYPSSSDSEDVIYDFWSRRRRTALNWRLGLVQLLLRVDLNLWRWIDQFHPVIFVFGNFGSVFWTCFPVTFP